MDAASTGCTQSRQNRYVIYDFPPTPSWALSVLTFSLIWSSAYSALHSMENAPSMWSQGVCVPQAVCLPVFPFFNSHGLHNILISSEKSCCLTARGLSLSPPPLSLYHFLHCDSLIWVYFYISHLSLPHSMYLILWGWVYTVHIHWFWEDAGQATRHQ